nr:MAG TPA: hypothetical protein [Caudoviricetes sp.]
MKFTVKLNGEKQGTYSYQVAMNLAIDLAEDENFSTEMITINGKPYSYWFC